MYETEVIASFLHFATLVRKYGSVSFSSPKDPTVYKRADAFIYHPRTFWGT